MYSLKCSSCGFNGQVATENDAETVAFAHCRDNPDHKITCTRPAHFHPGSIPMIVFSTEVR